PTLSGKSLPFPDLPGYDKGSVSSPRIPPPLSLRKPMKSLLRQWLPACGLTLFACGVGGSEPKPIPPEQFAPVHALIKPVAGDDWYQRRRQDAEGAFFRKVADQGPRKGAGGSTRQGIYCLTPDGTLLAYKNAGQAPDVMREVLRRGLAEWKKLPATRRKP